MRILLLLFIMISLFGVDKDLIDARNKIKQPVLIIFELTVVNKDNNTTTKTTTIEETILIKDWEKSYRPLTLLELKTYGPLGYIKALPVTVTIQTI